MREIVSPVDSIRLPFQFGPGALFMNQIVVKVVGLRSHPCTRMETERRAAL